MGPRCDDETLIRRYLLGELSEEDQRLLEERLMTDEAYFQQLLLLEDDLADDYVQDKLSPSEQARFENHFMAAPERRQKVKLAMALRRYVAEQASPALPEPAPAGPPPAAGWRVLTAFRRLAPMKAGLALAGLLLLVTAGALGLFIQTVRQRTQIQQRQAWQAELQRANQALQQQLAEQQARQATLPPPRAHQPGQGHPPGRDPAAEKPAAPLTEPARHAPVVALALEPGRTRAAVPAAQVELPANTRTLQLQLTLEDDRYPHYHAELRTAEGTSVWKRGHLPSQPRGAGKAVVVVAPAGGLTPGDYLVTLSGETPDRNYDDHRVATYFFRLTKK